MASNAIKEATSFIAVAITPSVKLGEIVPGPASVKLGVGAPRPPVHQWWRD